MSNQGYSAIIGFENGREVQVRFDSYRAYVKYLKTEHEDEIGKEYVLFEWKHSDCRDADEIVERLIGSWRDNGIWS